MVFPTYKDEEPAVAAAGNAPTEKVAEPTKIEREILKSPLTGNLVASADGEVTTLFPTGHAIGIKTHVQQGDKVKQ